MYNDLLSILKPLVYEGKSGILQITYAYDDQAHFYLKEGIIEQVTTSKFEGEKALRQVSGWVSFQSSFLEDEQGDYTPTTEIGTAAILSFLEKSSKTIAVIQKKIPNNDVVLQINSDKLNSVDTLTTENLKIAVLFDGTRSIEQTLKISGKSELALLAHTCRLIMTGVAQVQEVRKELMTEEEHILFMHSLEEMLTQLIGLAAPILMDDAFAAIGCQPESLGKEDIPSLLEEIRKSLDDNEREELDQWERAYFGRPAEDES